MKEVTKKWIKIAEYDYQTAKAMFKTKRYLYVIYCCHQATEKFLKARISEIQKNLPPYTHNLVRLLKLSKIEDIPQKFEKNIYRLDPYYLPTKYPDVKQDLLKNIDRKFCKEILDSTGGFIKWLKPKLN